MAKHNKLKKLVVRALSKYLSEDQLEAFIKTDKIAIHTFKLPNEERSYPGYLRIRYYKDNKNTYSGWHDLFEIIARKQFSCHHFHSNESFEIEHELVIDSDKIFKPLEPLKGKSEKKLVEKEIRRFFEKQAMVVDNTFDWFYGEAKRKTQKTGKS